MANRHYTYFPWGNQDQDQEQDQEQWQDQDQEQDQDQDQEQSQSQSSENLNANGNLNGNLNLNGNANGNLNYNENTANNAANNTATNTTTVTTTVDVGVDVDGSAFEPSDDDFADFDLGCTTIDNIVMAEGDVSYDPGNEMNLDDILDGALNGKGNDVGTVNAQFNSLADGDVLHSATVGGNLDQTNTSHGGTSSTGDGIGFGGADPDILDLDIATGGPALGSGNGDDGSVDGSAAASAASSIDTTAFNQSIVMGANVMGNTVDMTVVGGSLTSSTVGDDALDA